MTNLTPEDLAWLRRAVHTATTDGQTRELMRQMVGTLIDEREELAKKADLWKTEKPIDMVLFCPACGQQHLDIGEFRKRVHRKHLCENTTEGPNTGCGTLFEPYRYATCGVTVEELRDRYQVDQALILALEELVGIYTGHPLPKGTDPDAVARLYRDRARCIVALTTSNYAFALKEEP
jgi:hypothetical protein